MKKQMNFEKHCNETKSWLHEIAGEMRCPGKTDWAFSVLKAVLHTLRDRITIQEVFHFSAQLPVLIRGIYFEGYKPAGKPVKMNLQEFMSQIKKLMGPRVDVPAAEGFRAVVIVLYNRTSHGELDDIKGVLPKDIQKLWTNLMSEEGELNE
jgi:uncharacterized protein (DUF2267 family)